MAEGIRSSLAIVRLARAAEESGWQGISTWDSLGVSMGSGVSGTWSM